jgi:hypothetical protein
MKRIKIDINVSDLGSYEKWHEREFLALKPIIDRVMKLLNEELN